MFKYVFKLKSSYSPDLTNPSDSDKSKGGIRLTYSITLVYYFTWVKLFKGKELQVVYFRRKLGNKTFLRPFKNTGTNVHIVYRVRIGVKRDTP